ncbi:MAG: hypothetical protein SFX73_08535 [Kofleriaceae bacterium]|nr:hypothetical protein [Kofleriaceae bacterium]
MRFPSRIAVLAAVALLTFSASAAAVFAADTPLVLVVEGPGTAAPKNRKREIRPAIEYAAKQAGAEIVSAARVPGLAAAPCADAACATKAAVTAGATHVILSESAYVDDGFKIRLELYDARTGRTLRAEGQSCEVCTFPAFLKALRESTTLLCTRGFAEQPEPAPVPAPVAPPIVTAPAPIEASPAPIVAATEAPRREAPSTMRRVLPIVAVGAGVATAIAGVVVLSKDGEPTCDGDPNRCPFTRNTVAGGSALIGAGAVLAAAGAYFWWTTPSGDTAVAIGPAGLKFAGRF